MTSSDLNPIIWFLLNVSPEKLKLQDSTNYSGLGVAVADVIGNLKVTSPAGIVIYNNTSILSPDIDADISLLNNAVVSLPKDGSGNILTGTYAFRYSVREYNGGLVTANVNKIYGSSAQTVILSGDHAAAIADSHVFTIVTPLNPGTYQAVSAVYDAGTGETTVTMNTTALVDETPVGGTMTYKTRYDSFYVDFTRDYCAEEPTGDLSVESSCLTSTVTATDDTDYNISCNGTAVTPDSTSRVMTIIYPSTIVPTPPASVVTANASYTIGPNIYTGIYNVTLVTTCQYTLPSGLILVLPVVDQETHTVECSNCMCEVYSCLASLVQQWISYLGTNWRRAEELKAILDKVDNYWMLYSIAIQCGETTEAAAWCQAIVTLVND
jgi:hypothetical protein